MKIKKFNNIWTMGLILFGAILVTFYIAKLFFPEWIVGVAEIPRIVEIGEYIDSHLWAYHLFEIAFGMFTMYIYTCACCRLPKLKLKSVILMLAFTVMLSVCNIFYPQYYTMINCLGLVLLPFLIGISERRICTQTFSSLVCCLAVDILAQILSAEIRDLTTMISHFNTATFLVILIDGVIWRMLLYLYFNNKRRI